MNELNSSAARPINQREQEFQSAIGVIEKYRDEPLGGAIPSELKDALTQAFPPAKRTMFEIELDGRMKRRMVSPDWLPEKATLRYIDRPKQEPTSVAQSAQSTPAVLPVEKPIFYSAPSTPPLITANRDTSETESISQLCQALANAEKSGRPFIALKWFRDDALPTYDFAWATTADGRRAVLTKAISVGAIITGKIANPRDPLYPTTTVRLNRESAHAKSVPSRFQPVRAKGGASASAIILEDRGSY